EIAVKPGHHEQLLELLRRLRQSIELAGVNSRRHQIVSCAFGAGTRENWGVVFEKTEVHHPSANAGNYFRAQDDVGVQLARGQFEDAVLEPRVLRYILLRKYAEGKPAVGRQGAEQLIALHNDFDFAGRQP